MRFLPLLALLAAGCQADAPPRGVPPGGGGTGGGTGSTPDAMTPGGQDGGAQAISGRLCLVEDMRTPLLCESTEALGGIVVELVETGATTLTASDGGFLLPSPGGSSVLLKIAEGLDDGFRDVLTRADLINGQAANLRLPAIPDATWQDLRATIGGFEPDDMATIAAFLTRGGVPVTDADLLPPAGSLSAPFFAGPLGPDDWDAGRLTGESGGVLVFGAPANEPLVQLTVSPPQGDPQTFGEVPVLPNYLTFQPLDLP
jgi:hypothetical protein